MSQAAGARRLREDDLDTDYRPAPRLRVADGGQPPTRRTVTITGNPNPGLTRRRPPRGQPRLQRRPLRIALWPVRLGLFLAVWAVPSTSAAPLQEAGGQLRPRLPPTGSRGVPIEPI